MIRKLFISAAGALAALAAVATAAAMPAAPPGALPAAAGRAGPMAAVSPNWASYSHTWAGYMAPVPAGRKVIDVNAFWTMPQPDTSRVWGKPPYYAAEWAGMDGFGTGSHPVYGPIQDGVWSRVDSKGGTPSFYLFWEMAGPGDPGPQFFTTDNGPVKPDNSNLVRVHPGDMIGADVQWGDPPVYDPAGKEFYFTVTVYPGGDIDRPEMHVATARPPSSWPADQLRNRAEVITEIPSTDGGNSPTGAMDPGVIRYSGAGYLPYYQAGAALNGEQPVAQKPIYMLWPYSSLGTSWVAVWPSAPYQDPGYTFKDGFATRLHHYGL